MTAENNGLINALIATDSSTKKDQNSFASAMQNMGFTSVFDIVRMPRYEFAQQLRAFSDASADLAYDNAMGYAALIARLYREHKTSSGNVQHLAQRSGVRSLTQLGPTFANLFKENWDEFCKVGALAAVDSPVAYLSELRGFIRELDSISTDPKRILLDQRRPDLQHLLITQESTQTPRPMLEIVNDVLTRNLKNYLNGVPADKTKSIYQVLTERRYPFDLPYNFYHQQCQLGLDSHKPKLGELNYRISQRLPIGQYSNNDYGVIQQPALQAQRWLTGLSPQQQDVLITPSPFSDFYLTREQLADLKVGWQHPGSSQLSPHAPITTGYLLPAGQQDIGVANPAANTLRAVNAGSNLATFTFRKPGDNATTAVKLKLNSGAPTNTSTYYLNGLHSHSAATICSRFISETALPEPVDAHDDAQQCWYLSEAKAEYRHLEDPEGWRLGLPYRQRGNALVLQKTELKAGDIHHQQMLEWADDQPDWAAKAVLSGLSLQRYQDPATGQLLDPDQLTFNALPDYSETAELDASALSAYDKLRDDNGEMPFNLKEKLQSPEVGYHIMQPFLPDAPAAASEDSNDARDYLWSVRKGFPTYRGLAGFHSVEKFQQTRSHGITTVAYDEYACLCTAVTLPDGCTTRIRNLDYRSFLPAALEDPNRNTQEARYNAFGEVLVSSFYGTELGVDVGFDSLRDYQLPADRTPANALADKHKALGNYATATFSAPFSWMGKVPANAPAPWLTWAASEGLVLPDGHLRSRARWYLEGLENPGANERQLQRYIDESQREPVHVATLQADRYPGDPQLQIRASIACQDGFGRALQTKQEVEPGLAWVVNDKGELELDENGHPREAHAPRRWRVSERVEYNNKGETVRTYRPYFASAYRYINDAATRQSAYHDQQFYDAAGRPTHTVLAKRMAQGPDSQLKPLRREQRYRCWYRISFDENDLFDPPPVKRRSL